MLNLTTQELEVLRRDLELDVPDRRAAPRPYSPGSIDDMLQRWAREAREARELEAGRAEFSRLYGPDPRDARA